MLSLTKKPTKSRSPRTPSIDRPKHTTKPVISMGFKAEMKRQHSTDPIISREGDISIYTGDRKLKTGPQYLYPQG